ncbi:S24 family peptidase [Variovorax sp. J22P168]|uniref:LexA family protein n=1 Tax=Variovorax jilinensis TaxID=3053513 RepID=UPI002575DF5C|nr:S24 family peptidase [Variovorax sp. J22P168]MDM0015446.1 S24 family peptidase [Variovorax sp. J22P168]
MTLHRLIREGRLALGMTEQQFADALGVSRGAVQSWEKPGGTAPKRANQPRVAKLLGMSVADMLSATANFGPDAPTRQTRAVVPLVSEVEAGNYTAIDNFKGVDHLETIPVTTPVQRHTYALRVHGDSMEGTGRDSFPEGSLIVVEPQMAPLPGDYVIVLNKANETTFKQLVKDAGELFLKPLNPRYAIRPLGDAVVIGVVRELIKRFR